MSSIGTAFQIAKRYLHYPSWIARAKDVVEIKGLIPAISTSSPRQRKGSHWGQSSDLPANKTSKRLIKD